MLFVARCTGVNHGRASVTPCAVPHDDLVVFGTDVRPSWPMKKSLLDFGCARSYMFGSCWSILFKSRLGSLSFSAVALGKRRRRDRVFDRLFVDPTVAKGFRV